MQARSKFLPEFYYSDFWKEHRNVPNSLLANNDEVYLIRPLVLRNDSLLPVKYTDALKLQPGNSIAVIDFCISNTKMDQLLNIYARQYLPLLHSCGISSYTLWSSEWQPNDFPALPVFQDKNLFVMIAFYKNEADYNKKMDLVKAKTSETLKADLRDAITLKSTLILYPTKETRVQ